jgi:hypothetical protein
MPVPGCRSETNVGPTRLLMRPRIGSPPREEYRFLARTGALARPSIRFHHVVTWTRPIKTTNLRVKNVPTPGPRKFKRFEPFAQPD